MIKPGDVIVVRDTSTVFGWLILFGAWLRRMPLYSHVIVFSHVDEAGTWWGIEGRPSGVGQVEIAPWLARKSTLTTEYQLMTEAQGLIVVHGVDAMRGTRYDWPAIIQDAMDTIGAPELWSMREYDGVKGVPVHVVCSSLAAFWRMTAGLPTPKPVAGKWRRVTPTQWAKFILGGCVS